MPQHSNADVWPCWCDMAKMYSVCLDIDVRACAASFPSSMSIQVLYIFAMSNIALSASLQITWDNSKGINSHYGSEICGSN